MAKWTDVQDKLPEDFVDVLVLMFRSSDPQDPTVKVSSIQKRNVTCADHKLIKIRTWDGVDFNGHVTHWTRLPKLPKVKE